MAAKNEDDHFAYDTEVDFTEENIEEDGEQLPLMNDIVAD